MLLSEEMASSKPKRERDSPAQDEDTMRQRETRAGRMGRGMSCWAVWIFI